MQTPMEKDSADYNELHIRTSKFLRKDCRIFYSEVVCLPHTRSIMLDNIKQLNTYMENNHAFPLLI